MSEPLLWNEMNNLSLTSNVNASRWIDDALLVCVKLFV